MIDIFVKFGCFCFVLFFNRIRLIHKYHKMIISNLQVSNKAAMPLAWFYGISTMVLNIFSCYYWICFERSLGKVWFWVQVNIRDVSLFPVTEVSFRKVNPKINILKAHNSERPLLRKVLFWKVIIPNIMPKAAY